MTTTTIISEMILCSMELDSAEKIPEVMLEANKQYPFQFFVW